VDDLILMCLNINLCWFDKNVKLQKIENRKIIKYLQKINFTKITKITKIKKTNIKMDYQHFKLSMHANHAHIR
jgi:hypothetical protein